ncbi:MAG: hypothetical protein II561_01585, partial [Thermoguttaceae bacterium]|nr:hypothetical protein [Thermoguttaceae bacterium]
MHIFYSGLMDCVDELHLDKKHQRKMDKICLQMQEDLNALLDATPNSATRRQAIIYNAFGDVYAAAKKPEEAIVAYLHVDLLYPAARGERVKALKALVGLWREIGRTDRAVETKRLLRDRFNVDVDAQGSGR